MDRLALKLIDIHRIHHLWIQEQEERQTAPENPHVVDTQTLTASFSSGLVAVDLIHLF